MPRDSGTSFEEFGLQSFIMPSFEDSVLPSLHLSPSFNQSEFISIPLSPQYPRLLTEIPALKWEPTGPLPERTSGRSRKNTPSDAVKKVHANRRKHVAPYKCEKCVQTFTAKHKLIEHRKSHPELTPFKCKLCADGFGRKVALARHVKLRHDDQTRVLNRHGDGDGEPVAC
ncbi:hypothetical protein BDZ89DRAFT_1140169 [Hymenopellis radicata]|nr:hypothetical protein BDZ89DRAFT_1140169 [Hymenopellis radicata]